MSSVAELIQRELLTVAGLCRLYRITRRTYENWMKSVNPPPCLNIEGKRFFLRSELLQWRQPKEQPE